MRAVPSVVRIAVELGKSDLPLLIGPSEHVVQGLAQRREGGSHALNLILNHSHDIIRPKVKVAATPRADDLLDRPCSDNRGVTAAIDSSGGELTTTAPDASVFLSRCGRLMGTDRDGYAKPTDQKVRG